jgi:hypothetical protein
MMKQTATAISLGLLLALTQANLIVDREVNIATIAEDIPTTVKYTFYNTFG